MLIDGSNYAPSMVKFLNQFSRKCESHDEDKNRYLESLFKSFMEACSELNEDAFLNKRNRRFNIALFEAVFTAACESAFDERRILRGTLDGQHIATLENDAEFLKASLEGTTRTANVSKRIQRAREIVGSL